jgi:tRNA dimethylallyltransferase
VACARPKLIVVCGPTATGKTALAVELAVRLNGEIVNADSMQVYRLMDIGTAKPTPAEREAARFHLIDVADPDDTFSTGRFKDAAGQAVADILARGRLPIVAGGTGLYIKALTKGLWDGPSADHSLRRKFKALEAAEPGLLHRRLVEVDPDRAAQVHPADLVRIERALEVLELTGKPISVWQREHAFAESPFQMLSIGLARGAGELAGAVEERVDAMMAAGWLEEVRVLREKGYGPELPSQAAIGYRELHQHFDGLRSLSETIERAKASTRRFAKRQRTWFAADGTIRWFDAVSERGAALDAAEEFLQGNDLNR